MIPNYRTFSCCVADLLKLCVYFHLLAERCYRRRRLHRDDIAPQIYYQSTINTFLLLMNCPSQIRLDITSEQ